MKKDEADILFILKKKQKKRISAFLLIKQNQKYSYFQSFFLYEYERICPNFTNVD